MAHLTGDLLRLAIAGELPPGTLSRALHRHLLEACPGCAREWREAVPRLAEAAPRAADAGRAALPGGGDARELARQARAVSRARTVARRDLLRLLRTPPESWRQMVADSRSRFRSRATVELVVAHGRELTRSDPHLAAELLAFVPQLLLWAPGGLESDWARDLAVRAEARRANAVRVTGDLAAADRLFELARRRLAAKPAADRTVYAEVASLEASLRRDERRYEEAGSLLDRAVFLSNEAGDREGVARALIQRAEIGQHFERHDEALADLARARELLDADQQPFLYLLAVCSAAPTLLDLGRPAEAEHLLLQAEAAAVAVEPWWALRIRYLKGRAAHLKGDRDRAIQLLGEARRGFVAQKLPYDVAAVSLDLALVHLDRGAAREAARLARQIAPVFRAVGVEREALATLRVFQQATAEEARRHLAALRQHLAAAQAERDRAKARPTPR
jgi:tetratricopeptide (TPR) repeat protein